MPEKFDFSKIEDQKEFENLSYKKDNIVGEAQEEAERFNKILSEGKVSSEYLSLVLKNQAPEQVEKIAEKIMEKTRIINHVGALYHCVKELTTGKISDMINNRLKSKNTLKYEKRFEPGFHREVSNFPYMVSFYMITDKENYITAGFERRREEQERDLKKEKGHKLSERQKNISASLVLNPEYLKMKFQEKRIPDVVLVAHNFEKPGIKEKIMKYFSSVGWLEKWEPPLSREDLNLEIVDRNLDDEEIKNLDLKKIKSLYDELLLLGKFTRENLWKKHTIFAQPHENEVLIDEGTLQERNERGGLLCGPPVDGIVIAQENSATIIDWLNNLSSKDLEKAIPIYDVYGNLLWPARIDVDNLTKFVAERDKNNK